MTTDTILTGRKALSPPMAARVRWFVALYWRARLAPAYSYQATVANFRTMRDTVIALEQIAANR